MSTTDVHRLLDNALPEGKKCEGVTMYEVWEAVIDGEKIQVSAVSGTLPDDITAQVMTQLGSTKNAAVEGAEAEDDELEDNDDDDDAEDDTAAAKTSSRLYKKKK